MDKSDAFRRWFGLWRAADPSAQDDPAGLGTAFGLDMSLSELADDAPALPTPMDGQGGWMQRVAARLRPAG